MAILADALASRIVSVPLPVFLIIIWWPINAWPVATSGSVAKKGFTTVNYLTQLYESVGNSTVTLVTAPNRSTFSNELVINGTDPATGDCVTFYVQAMSRSDGSTMTIPNTPSVTIDSDAALSTSTAKLIGTGNQLQIDLTSPVSLNWNIVYKSIQYLY